MHEIGVHPVQVRIAIPPVIIGMQFEGTPCSSSDT